MSRIKHSRKRKNLEYQTSVINRFLMNAYARELESLKPETSILRRDVQVVRGEDTGYDHPQTFTWQKEKL
jgi:hypothetical protein